MERVLLPVRCPGCGQPSEAHLGLCDVCWRRVPALPTPVCARCLLEGAPPDGCARHPGDRVHAPWLYDERLAAVVHAFKFEGRVRLADTLAPAMADAVARGGFRPELVLAVPLHATRRRERGHDQAERLALAVARALGVPYVPGVVQRARATRPQTTLGPEARRRNLAGAFRVLEPAWVEGRRTLVVDDVLTTGATLAEVLAALRVVGARTRGAVAGWAS